MGAAIVIMRNRGINPMESGLGLWIGLNLLITFTIPGISIGGHLGGLIGGAVAAALLYELRDRVKAPPALPAVLCAALAAAAVALAVVAVGVVGFGADAFGWLDAVRANQARTSSFSLPYKTAELLGAILPGGRVDFAAAVRFAYAAAFAGIAAWLLWRSWRGADAIAMAGWATLALLLCSAWLVPWYVAWLLPLAALSGSRRLAAATVALTAWTLAIAIPF
jgi:hypothetical protein